MGKKCCSAYRAEVVRLLAKTEAEEVLWTFRLQCLEQSQNKQVFFPEPAWRRGTLNGVCGVAASERPSGQEGPLPTPATLSRQLFHCGFWYPSNLLRGSQRQVAAPPASIKLQQGKKGCHKSKLLLSANPEFMEHQVGEGIWSGPFPSRSSLGSLSPSSACFCSCTPLCQGTSLPSCPSLLRFFVSLQALTGSRNYSQEKGWRSENNAD